MTVLLGSPTQAPPPPPALVGGSDPFASMRVSLTSWDGSRWNLRDYTSGVFLTRDSVLPTGMPPRERRATASASEPGTRYRSHRVGERFGILALHVFGGSSQEWLDRDAALWRAFRPDRTAILTVQAPGASPRSLQVRYVGDDEGMGMDPFRFGWANYVLEVVAEQPFWEGAPIEREWAPTSAQPFYGGNSGGGFATPYFISSAFRLDNARIDNPGDVDGYAVWTVEAVGGDVTSVTVGVGGRLVTYADLIPDGSSLVIDPRPGPRGKSAYLDGVRVTSALSPRDFAAIPAGEAVPLSLSMVGPGRVSASLTPMHYRAWG